MADDELNEAIRLSLQSAQEEEKKRKTQEDEERGLHEALQKAIQISVEESPEGKENRQLQDEVDFLRTKVRLLEDASKVDVERTQLRSLFHLVNANGAGESIAPPQFAQLMETVSGKPVTPEEVSAAFRSIAPANPAAITFDEFYKWWHQSSFSTTDPVLSSLRRLAVPSHRELFLRLGRRLLYNQDGLFPSPLNSDTSKLSVKVATASFQPKCGGRLYYINDAKLAETRRKEMKVLANEADSLILSMSLSFVDGVDEFDLGELAGSLKDLLSLAKDEVSYSSYQVNLAKENGKKRFRIVLCFRTDDPDDENMQMITSFITNLNLRNLNCNIGFSQSFNPAEDDKKPIEAQLQLDAEVNTKLIDWVFHAAEQTQEKNRPKYMPPRDTDLIQIFQLLQRLNLDVSLENLTQKWRQSFEDKKGPSRIVLGWREINKVLLRALAPAADNETARSLIDLDIPELVWNTYKNALETFREVANISVQYQHQILSLDLNDMAVFQLFPSVEQLKALPRGEKEEKSSKKKPKQRPARGNPVANDSKLAHKRTMFDD